MENKSNINRIKVGNNYVNLVIPVIYKDFEELRKILDMRIDILECMEIMED